MKKFKLLSVVLLIATAVGFVSCDSEPVDPVLLDEYEDTPGTPGSGAFKVNFDGQTFVADQTMASVGNGLIQVAGFKTNGKSVSITIDGTSTGTYTEEALMVYSPDATGEYGYMNVDFSTGDSAGTVTITSIDAVNKTISGTFSFKGWWTGDEEDIAPIEFTNGSFQNVPYVGTGDVNTGDDEFEAVVDGESIDYVNDIAVAYTGPGQYITITAVGSDHKFSLTMKDDVTAGNTYPIVHDPFATVSADFEDDMNEYNVTEGSVTITAKTSTRIKGTFSFDVIDPVTEQVVHTVEQGSFDVEYDW